VVIRRFGCIYVTTYIYSGNFGEALVLHKQGLYNLNTVLNLRSVPFSQSVIIHFTY